MKSIYNPNLRGYEIQSQLKQIIDKWQENESNKYLNIVKGVLIYTEQYSVFSSVCDYSRICNEILNFSKLLEDIQGGNIYVVGEAMTHCVKESIKDYIDLFPEYVKNLVILTDCMSPIDKSFNIYEDEVFQQVIEQGGRFSTSIEEFL